jgi:hypothetical protein
MKSAALGFRVHSGWTALIAISLDQGFPRVLLRQHPHLVQVFTYEFRQPYHTAGKRQASEARGVISHARADARRLAYQAIHSARTSLEEQGYEINCSGLLLASGKSLPVLSKILKSHALIHAADGELFREALLHASTRCGFKIFTVRERELLDCASEALHLKPDDLGRRVAGLGSALGSPWSRDEKLAALFAWLSLAKQ